MIDTLRQRCGLEPLWTVADIGSGPGNLTRLFLDHGNRVFGVEPNRAMREGIDGAGHDLYPALPYDHFTKLEDEDLSVLYAFLITRRPCTRRILQTSLPFPIICARCSPTGNCCT